VRLALLGGSFDPPHVGHLLAAGDAFEALSLDRLVLIPAAVQPLKVGRAAGTGAQRLAMTRLLVDGDERFAVDPIEIERDGLSYTVDTLATFAERYPDAERYFLVGADVFSSFHKWREPERIVQLATLAVLQRAGETPNLAEVLGKPVLLPTRRVDISSTEIRDRVRQGKSIRGFVPEAVAAFIEAERLYR
jgi:nicotinate-nucleotide adenylyltransferase